MVERVKEVLDTDFPSGKVIFHTVSKRPYILNNTASELWDYCRTPKDVDNVIKYLCKEFAIGSERAKRDVKAFIDDMRKRKVVRVYERRAGS